MIKRRVFGRAFFVEVKGLDMRRNLRGSTYGEPDVTKQAGGTGFRVLHRKKP